MLAFQRKLVSIIDINIRQTEEHANPYTQKTKTHIAVGQWDS